MGTDAIRFVTDKYLRITDISWERIFLCLTVETDADTADDTAVSLSLASISRKKGITAEYPLTPCSSVGGILKYRINMSIADGKQFISKGKWYFISRAATPEERAESTPCTGAGSAEAPGTDPAYGQDSGAVSFCCVTYDLAYRLRYLAQVFPYGSKYAYVVSFMPECFDDENIVPVMTAKFYMENPDWDKTYVVRQQRGLRKKLRCLGKKSRVSFLQAIYDAAERSAKKDGRNILLISETRPYLWGNLKALDDRLRERGLDKEYNISYSFRNTVGRDESLSSWIETVRKLAKQDIIFVDDYAPVFGFLKLSSRTKLVQLWHAGIGFKSVGYARFGLDNSPFPAENCHRSYDAAVTGAKRLVPVYSEVFAQPEEKILPLGLARLDGFLDEAVAKEKTDSFYAEHPELRDRKLILFCPTYRGANQREAYYDYGRLDMERIYEFCGDEYAWAFKMHPFVKEAPPIPEGYKDRIIDLTAAKDINDLYFVTDIMITDYSSAYYEYTLLKKPLLFYAYDREVYEITRGVQNTILETAPGRVCGSFDEIMQALETKEYGMERTVRFSEENFGEYDSRATDRIIDTLILN